jgi:putative nucleotidyltransferase with HDIG domain
MARPAAGQLFVYAMIALGAVVVTSAVSELEFSRPGLFAALLALSVLSAALTIDTPLGEGSSSVSLSYAVDFTALLLLGPAPTMLIALGNGWSQCTLRTQERSRPSTTLFNMATLAVSVAAAGFTYTKLGGAYGTLRALPLQPAMAAATIYVFVSSFAPAAAFALSEGRGMFRVWHDNVLWVITSCVVGTFGMMRRIYRIYLTRISEQQKRIAERAQLHRDSTEVLARAIQAKDEGGSRHVERVQYYASALARSLELSDRDRQGVEIAALLHDIGKLAVPEHILSKPGPLTSDERSKMQVHAQIGAEIVSAVPFPCAVAPLIRSHHERWDGTGYPSGLRGEQIPIGARVLSVADFFDALTSTRPYRPALSSDVALGMLQAEAGKAFDPAVVARFTELLPMLGLPDRLAETASEQPENDAPYESGESAGRNASLVETMTLVSATISTMVPFSLCGLFVRSTDKSLQCRFAIGAHADLLAHASIADGEGLSGWVARHRRPLVNGLPLAEFKAAGVQVCDVDLRSALICPLTLREEVIGTIALFHDVADAYTDDHRRMLDQVAVRAASIVQKAVLFEVTKSLTRARKTPPAPSSALVLLDRAEAPRGRERVSRRR